MSAWTVQVSAGVGPVEVRQFVALLALHLQVRCVAEGMGVQSFATQGDEEAPRSVEFVVLGPVRELLGGSVGTHVLVARSAQRGRRARKRWFVGVSLHEERAPVACKEIRASDVEVTAARAGGPGGQHVNTTDSAVRVRHKPSGITVRVTTERSQHQNRSIAMARLAAILAQRDQRARAFKAKELRLSHYQFERGSAVQEWQIDERTAQLRQVNHK